MGILNYSRKVLLSIVDASYRLGQLKGEIKKDKDSRRIEKYSKIILTEAQKKQIDDVYTTSYGKKVKYDWHRYYQSFTGTFDAQYFAEYLLSTKLEPKMNPVDYRYVLGDKLLLQLFCMGVSNVRTPKTYCTKYEKLMFLGDKKIVSMDEVDKYLPQIMYIIKPVQDTNSGAGVERVFGAEEVKKSFKCRSEKALVAQECVGQQKLLKKLYPSGVNTFRVITYILNGQLYHVPLTLRMGRGGSFLDNCHAGGLFIGVDDDGYLNEYAYTEYGNEYGEKFSSHPDTNVKFKGYKLDFVPEMIQIAKKMHLNTPQLGMISWDITVDENNCFVLIEANTRGQSIDMPQEANGKSAFGENTKEILKMISRG